MRRVPPLCRGPVLPSVCPPASALCPISLRLLLREMTEAGSGPVPFPGDPPGASPRVAAGPEERGRPRRGAHPPGRGRRPRRPQRAASAAPAGGVTGGAARIASLGRGGPAAALPRRGGGGREGGWSRGCPPSPSTARPPPAPRLPPAPWSPSR